MAREFFVDTRFQQGTRDVIAAANLIISEFQAEGFTLTLRQLYYQFVQRGWIANKQTEYNRLGGIVNNARLAGLLDWDAIEDRTRFLRGPQWWSDPNEALSECAEAYKEDLWANQTYYPEVWIEKDALVGVVEPVCDRLRLNYFACRGYASQSEQYRAGKRLAYQRRRGKEVVVFHLGDHDPSGIDMTRDNAERLSMFAGGAVRVVRLALNMDQIEEYNPPPNPAKDTDSRFGGYREIHGDSSWELDALSPTVIDQIIQDAVDDILDADQWDEDESRESNNRELLRGIAKDSQFIS